jgi:hypothetical protein
MLAHILYIDHVDILDNIIANTDFMICLREVIHKYTETFKTSNRK